MKLIAQQISRAERLLTKGQALEAMDILEPVLDVAREQRDTQREAEILMLLGHSFRHIREITHAIGCYQLAVRQFEALNDDAALADAHVAIAQQFFARDDLAQASSHYEQARLYAARRRDLSLQAHVATQLGTIALTRNRYADAARHFTHALPIHERDDAAQARCDCLIGLGDAQRMLGNLGAARRYYSEAADVAAPHLDHLHLGLSARGLGFCAVDEGDPTVALDHLERAFEHLKRVGDQTLLLSLRWQIGQQLVALRSYTTAIPHLRAWVDHLARRHDAAFRIHANYLEDVRERERRQRHLPAQP